MRAGAERYHHRSDRRIFHNPLELLRDVGRLLATRKDIGRLMGGHVLAPAFRERLMLAVTAVNGCRYCSFGHARMALQAGVTPEEIRSLAGGELAGVPGEELLALLYAQHWAETDGDPEPSAHERLVETYGREKAAAIELTLRVIRIGNLAGNTLDHVLFRLTFGRYGADARQPGAADPSTQATHA